MNFIHPAIEHVRNAKRKVAVLSWISRASVAPVTTSRTVVKKLSLSSLGLPASSVLQRRLRLFTVGVKGAPTCLMNEPMQVDLVMTSFSCVDRQGQLLSSAIQN